MFKKLHIRLTLLCAGITAVIMGIMSLGYLYVSEQSIRNSRLQAFENDLNTISTHLEQQSVITAEWLSKMEAGGNYRFYVVDNGVPFLYNRLGRNPQDGVQDSLLSDVAVRLIEKDVSGISNEENLCALRLGTDYSEYIFKADDVQYLGGVIHMGRPDAALEVILFSSLQRWQEQMAHQRIKFLLIDCAAVFVMAVFSYIFTGLLLRPMEENQKRQSAFVAAASHELRTPLAVVMSAAECCRSAGPERQEGFFKTITEEGRRMSSLIDDMLMLCQSDSQQMSVHRQEVELDTLLISMYEAFEPLAEKKSIAISLKLPQKAIPRCVADPERIRQLLAVLLHNAVSYTPEQGDIVLSLKYVPIHLTPGKGRFLITVEDNGIGIPKEDKNKIFDRFYRADRSRSGKDHFGLGLSVAHEIVKAHGGTITVADARGGGTIFTVTL